MEKILLVFTFMLLAITSSFAEETKYDVDEYKFTWSYGNLSKGKKITLVFTQDSEQINIGGEFGQDFLISIKQAEKLASYLKSKVKNKEVIEVVGLKVEFLEDNGKKIVKIKNKSSFSSVIVSPSKIDNLIEALEQAENRAKYIRERIKL